MTRTPEGFLICHNVPIARTGVQKYQASETGMTGNDLVEVYRVDDEVFSPAAIASFEGKPVTDNHPSGDVDPSNVGYLLKGATQNVRRGAGDDLDKVISDLVIYDAVLIDEVQSGKREVSCGYNCEYRQGDDGKIYQCAIRGNHVAIVERGRAGDTVAIKDGAIEEKEDKDKMAEMKKNKKIPLLPRMFAAFAKDADPEEVAAAADELMGANTETADTIAADEGAPDLAAVLAKILARLDALEKSEKAEAPSGDEDPLEKLEQDLSQPDEEESVTIPTEQLESTDTDTVEESQTTADALKSIIKDLKPHIAAMSNQAEKKKVSDALTAALRKHIPVKDSKATADGYKLALKAQQEAAKKRAESPQKTLDSDDYAKLDAMYAARNPHTKKEVK